MKDKSGEKFSFFQWLVGNICRCLVIFYMRIAFRPKVTYACGDKKKRHTDPAVYVCNHTHIYDGLMIITLLRYAGVYAILAKDWYEKKGLHFLLKANRCIPVDRYHPDTSWLKKAVKVLRSGHSVCIFPEGFISKSGEMRPFKPGFIMLANLAGVPVVPFAMARPYRPFFGKRKLVTIGEPYYLPKPDKNDRNRLYEEQAEKIRQMVLDMKNKMEETDVKGKEKYSNGNKSAADGGV